MPRVIVSGFQDYCKDGTCFVDCEFSIEVDFLLFACEEFGVFDVDSVVLSVIVQLLQSILRRLQKLRTLRTGVQVIIGYIIW